MTDLIVTDAGDAWVNSDKTGLNYGSAAWVQVKSGERYALVWPQTRSILGETPLASTLTGRVGPGHVGQTYTVAPITERWSPGRVTWGSDGGPAVNLAAAVTETVGALGDGETVDFDLTAMRASVAAGTPWYGVRITTDSTTAGQKFYATDSGQPAWEFIETLSDAPEQPSNLRPDGGAVDTATPPLAWDDVDLGTGSEQAAFVVQVDTPAVGMDPDEVTPDFDSGWIGPEDGGTEPQFDLDASAHTPSGAGPHYWRVKAKDAAGVESDWSDWASYTVAALGALVIDSPTGPFGDPSPTILAHVTGVDDADLTWKAEITGPDRSDIRARSELQTGAIVWQVPERNKDKRRVIREDKPGWLHLRVWDDVDRAVAVGQQPHLEAWVALEFDDDLGVTAPTALTVVQPTDNHPRLRWTFAMPEAPTAVLLQADGVTVRRVEAEDLTVSAGFYSCTDNGEVAPMRPQELSVRAVEDSQRSAKASHPVQHSHTVEGLWLLPEADIDPILLDGTAVGDFGRSDRVATYEPLVGSPIEVVYDYVGMSGSFAGTVDNRDGDVWEKVALIEALIESRNRLVRMVWGSHSITARVSDLSVVAADEIRDGYPLHNVRFRFAQVGD